MKIGDIVEGIKHPKYKNKPFNGQGTITSIPKTPKQYIWVDWYYGFGMVNKNDVILSKDQTKIIYEK
tara:strand:- start:184 stop:384 length:201 start_codon:yes stop_codon:yes gene_type:complete